MTIKINQNATNIAVLTLRESASDQIAYNWLLRFVNDETSKEYLSFFTDISIYPDLHQRFEIVEPTDIAFDQFGDFTYYAYQMPDTDDMDYTRGILVESEKSIVIETPTTRKSFSVTKNNKVFNG